jgi:tetratricopeptide (TPR) repeat protein
VLKPCLDPTWEILQSSFRLLLGLVFLSCAAGQQQALYEAARLDAEQKCAEAERYYREALADGPPSLALLNNTGNHFLICGQPEKAKTYFERLLRMNPAHPNANLQLARIAAERRQGQKALAYLAMVNDHGPDLRLLRAEASYWAGKRAAALAVLDGLQQDARENPRLLFLLGTTCARIGLYDRAEAAFNAALLKRPDDFDVLVNLGRAAARERHYDRAQRALEVALKLRPQDVDAMFELGRVYGARQDYSRAVYLLAQASQKAPRRPDILLALARAAEDAGYYGDSALAYDGYLQLQPSDDAARRDRARVYGYTGARLDEGLRELAQYLRRHPKDPVAYYDLAQLSWRSDPQTALDQLSKALRLDPNFVPALYSRAWLLNRLGETAKAAPDLQAAIQVDPGNFRALDQLGLTYLSLDRPSEAEKVLRRALALSPEDPEILMHLGRAVMALGREDEAQRYLDKFQKVRQRRVRNPRREAGMIELATLPASARAEREIERLRQEIRGHPGDAELQLHLAVLLLAEGRVAEAVPEYRKLLEMNANSRIWEQAGTSLLNAAQYELSQEFLRRAVLERPAASVDLALALYFSGAPKQALEVIEAMPEGERAGDYMLIKAAILDAAGQAAEAEKILTEGIQHAVSRPEVAQQAALLLLRHARKTEALEILEQAIRSTPDNSDLLLTKVIVLMLADQALAAERVLKQIESRWPEWDRPYLVHGLYLEHLKRNREAVQKLQTAVALGSQDPAASCAVARLKALPPPSPQCTCIDGLLQWLFPSCGEP